MKKVLNVGGNNKRISLPGHYAEFEHILLDIDPKGAPDIVCDARDLDTLEANQFDAVYCSHNMEHYFRHDVQKVLAGFFHVLKKTGFVQIKVPDIGQLMRIVARRGLDIDDILYQSPAGPIMVLDVLYGYNVEIERSGKDYYAHKTGFTQKSLSKALRKSGFLKIIKLPGKMEVNLVAFKAAPDEFARSLFGMSSD